MPDVIITRRLTKYYGPKCVVDSLNLRVPQGCVYGFLGRNGAGKSTTIKMLLGMARPNYGQAELFGENADQLRPETRARIAYLAEGHPLYRWMTVGEAVRRQVVLKIFVGSTLYLVVGAIPILLYAWWAATPGTHASPFLWSMTEPAWRIWWAMILVHLGAFTSGLRPAAWLGSRLWPLAATGGAVFVIALIPSWPSAVVWLGVVVLAAALLLANVASIAGQRDYP
jgi:energy-coupling factor transporter ATP-binding protein EcfA2